MKEYIKIISDGSWLVLTTLEALDFIQSADDPKEYSFEVIKLTEEEFENLPEFDGF